MKHKVLPSYVNSPYHKVHHSFDSMKLHEANIESKILDCWVLLSRAIVPKPSSNTAQVIGEAFVQYWGSYILIMQHIHKTLYRLMLHTYQQVDYSLKPRTACCTDSWCQSIEVMYVEKWCLAGVKLWPSHLPAGMTSGKFLSE